jgi:diguanylate cyclase (GGDEF)-like protein
MSLKVKIILLSVLPFLTLLYFAASEIKETVHERDNLTVVYNRILEAEKISNVVHELQKERGFSAGFLMSGGAIQKKRLILQRVLSDHKIDELNEFLKEIDTPSNVASLYKGLESIRGKVTSLTTDPIGSHDYYSKMIAALLDRVSEIAKVVIIPEIKDELAAHLNLLHAKESLGQIRAALIVVFISEKFDVFSIKRLDALKVIYDMYSKEFLSAVSGGVRKIYVEKFLGKSIRATMDMIDIAVTRHNEGNFNVNPDVWFETATISLDVLKEVEDYSKGEIKLNTSKRLSRITASLTMKTIVIPVTITVVLILSLSITNNIFTSSNILLSSITNIMETKDFSNRIPTYSNDELGTISKAYNKLLETIERLINEKEYLATTDSLTQIYNRLKFDELFNIESERAKRYTTALSLIIFDIDYFKQINDTFGHDAGNYVLIEVSNIANKNIRSSDVLARWGGDEFVILVPEINIDGSKQLAEKLRNEVEGFDFKKIGKVTCSFGVGEFKEGDNAIALFKRVDIALYNAKDSGRNRVCANYNDTELMVKRA